MRTFKGVVFAVIAVLVLLASCVSGTTAPTSVDDGQDTVISSSSLDFDAMDNGFDVNPEVPFVAINSDGQNDEVILCFTDVVWGEPLYITRSDDSCNILDGTNNEPEIVRKWLINSTEATYEMHSTLSCANGGPIHRWIRA